MKHAPMGFSVHVFFHISVSGVSLGAALVLPLMIYHLSANVIMVIACGKWMEVMMSSQHVCNLTQSSC